MSNIFELVRKKGQLPVATKPAAPTATKAPSVAGRTYAAGEKKAVDPVVARLKEKRRLEREKMEAELRQKKGLKPKPKPKPPGMASDSKTQAKRSPKPAVATAAPPPRPSLPIRPAKRMKFNELMKKASTIDQSKLSISIGSKTKSKSPETSAGLSARHDRANGAERPGRVQAREPGRARSATTSLGTSSRSKERPPAKQERTQAKPLPTRGPSEKLAHKLQEKKSKKSDIYVDDDESDDLSSFLASDEEDQSIGQVDYDRDEIWAMFNKGRKRSHLEQYDDYDSDDMEATGTEILDEELRSKRRAELEDKKELEEEQRRAELKRQRKLKASQKA